MAMIKDISQRTFLRPLIKFGFLSCDPAATLPSLIHNVHRPTCLIHAHHNSRGPQKPFHNQIRLAHNLGNRYKILEDRIRPESVRKELQAEATSRAADQTTAPPISDEELKSSDLEMETMNRGGSKSILRPKPRIFKGVMIPIKPPPPASDDCCMSSCTVCVYDLYATALEEYDEAQAKARDELSAKHIPPEEWPMDVLTEADRKRRQEEIDKSEGGVDAGRRFGVTGDTERERQMAVIIGAFVKFEQSLKEKRKAERLRENGGPPTNTSV
ncbi:hypothetical protein CPB86DRAFT_431173 [Serendipita vermifera]|nr:hypothetical protein CPB86DRAFT_431173 [Serendipita vermifera]